MKATYTNDQPKIAISAALKNGVRIVMASPNPIISDDFEVMSEDGSWLPGVYTKQQLVEAGADASAL